MQVNVFLTASGSGGGGAAAGRWGRRVPPRSGRGGRGGRQSPPVPPVPPPPHAATPEDGVFRALAHPPHKLRCGSVSIARWKPIQLMEPDAGTNTEQSFVQGCACVIEEAGRRRTLVDPLRGWLYGASRCRGDGRRRRMWRHTRGIAVFVFPFTESLHSNSLHPLITSISQRATVWGGCRGGGGGEA